MKKIKLHERKKYGKKSLGKSKLFFNFFLQANEEPPPYKRWITLSLLWQKFRTRDAKPNVTHTKNA